MNQAEAPRDPPRGASALRCWRPCGLVLVLVILGAAGAAGCGPPPREPAIVKLDRKSETPRDASVIIDEQYIGPLSFVARGIRLPAGEHRITVTKEGYFPYDELVEVDGNPIVINVELIPIPD